MKPKFSLLVQRYFERWISLASSTRWTGREPFYQFVKACKRYGKGKISSADVREAIKEAVISRRPDIETEALDKLAGEFTQEFQIIKEYEETPFPDHWVEMRDPIRIRLSLRGLGVSEEEINETLKTNFGENWEENIRRGTSDHSIPPKQLKESSQKVPVETK